MPRPTETRTIEIVLFKSQPGVTDDQILAVADALQRDVADLPGFLRRRLLKGDDGQWLDMVDWASLEEARQASAIIMQRPSAQEFDALVDGASLQVVHLEPRRVYGGASAPL
jgi:hypothetical protein